MRSHNVVDVIEFTEGLSDVRSELNANASLGLRSSRRVLRIAPHEVAHESLLRRLSIAIDGAQIVQSDPVAREQAAVHAEYARVD